MKKNGNYELLYIVHPDLESSIDKITDRVRSFIEKRGGAINYEESWGKRKLAYEIKKTDVGIYVLWFFSCPTSSVLKIEKDIRLTEEVIRFMITGTSEISSKKSTKKKTSEPKTKQKAEKREKTGEEKKAEKESEKVRMKKIDEKLGELLGKEDNKKTKKKEVQNEGS